MRPANTSKKHTHAHNARRHLSLLHSAVRVVHFSRLLQRRPEKRPEKQIRQIRSNGQNTRLWQKYSRNTQTKSERATSKQADKATQSYQTMCAGQS